MKYYNIEIFNVTGILIPTTVNIDLVCDIAILTTSYRMGLTVESFKATYRARIKDLKAQLKTASQGES